MVRDGDMEELFDKYDPEEEEPYYWVLPGELGGRCGPEMQPWSLDYLWEEGFRAMVSLHRLPPEEEQAIGASDLQHLPLYFPAMALDHPALRKKFLELTDDFFPFVDARREDDEPVLVHCYAGLDRTCCLICCYLISRMGYTAHGALETIREVNPDAFVSPGYEETVHLFEEETISG